MTIINIKLHTANNKRFFLEWLDTDLIGTGEETQILMFNDLNKAREKIKQLKEVV